MKFLLPFLLIIYTSCSQAIKEEIPRHVGDIAYDANIDSKDFDPCHEDLIPQYYQFGKGIQYEGEKAKIVRVFKDAFKPSSVRETGFITIRFIVNCEGKTGWFRVIEMDENYKEKVFSKDLTNQILTITKNLDGWKPGSANEKFYDYYQYLTFKIVKGNIEDIMP